MKTIRILSGGAAQGLVEALQPAFEASTGCKIDSVFGAVGAMKARLLAGALLVPLIGSLPRHPLPPFEVRGGIAETAERPRRSARFVERVQELIL